MTTKKNKIIKSPLRYPGSKQKLSTFVQTIFVKNNIKPSLFVEPFAGGASVSINLLQTNDDINIGLIDKDTLVASFWKCVFFDSEWLCKEISNLNISLHTWNYYKSYSPRTVRNKALKCLFLNRTNFSGILKAGPIGGKSQNSKYKIDCRFNKIDIIRRIKILSKYKDRVLFVEEGDYLTILKEKIIFFDKNTFIYFDPPYVNKAEGLYNHYFINKDHEHLRKFIKELKIDWLLSYDYEPLINNNYNKFANCGFFDIKYNINSKLDRKKKEEFLASNLRF